MTETEVSEGAYQVFIAGANPNQTSLPSAADGVPTAGEHDVEPELQGEDEARRVGDDASALSSVDGQSRVEFSDDDDEGSRPDRFDDDQSSVRSLDPNADRGWPGGGERSVARDATERREEYRMRERHDDEATQVSTAVSAISQVRSGVEFSAYMRRNDAGADRASAAPPRSERDVLLENYEKQQMILDLQRLRSHPGIVLSREWSMEDDIEDISFELKRLTLQVDEVNNVAMMRNGLQLACTGIEMMSKRYNILDLDGWSSEVCRDMTRYERGLGRLYRKYWRRSTASSPEADVAMSLVSSMAMFHLRRTFSKRVFDRGGGRARSGGGGAAPEAKGRSSRSARAPIATGDSSSDDEEGLPP